MHVLANVLEKDIPDIDENPEALPYRGYHSYSLRFLSRFMTIPYKYFYPSNKVDPTKEYALISHTCYPSEPD